MNRRPSCAWTLQPQPSASHRIECTAILIAASLLLGVVAATAAAPTNTLSSSPRLEAAVVALAENRLAEANTTFAALTRNPAASPFLRALALTGLAETSFAMGDSATARRHWDEIAADLTLPPGLRDRARRRGETAGRSGAPAPAYDADAHRTQLASEPHPALVLHVAVDGRDDADGSAANPFRSLERARDAVRRLRRGQGGSLPEGGVHVLVGAGEYVMRQPFQLTARDSGSPRAPIVYKAKSGESPILEAGIRITNWQRLTDEPARTKIPAALHARVRQANLRALGVTDFGDATALRRRPELFANGVPQTLARWPNEGFVKTGELLGKDRFKVWDRIEGCKDGRFRWIDPRPLEWLDEPDVRLYGYWFWDWYEEYQTVKIIDAADRAFDLSPPFAQYGYRLGQRYYALNILRELDHPGEWFLDRRVGKLYWLPPEELDSGPVTTVLSLGDQPLVALQDVAHVSFRGFTLQHGRGNALRIRGGSNVLVAACTIRRFGGDGVVIEGGREHGIFGCEFRTLGCGATRVNGGDRTSLVPGGHFVENCLVSDISRLKRTYTPAVHLEGCGNRVAHNRFENMPSSALRIEGNDHLIELNDVRHVVLESDDQGGLDMFGNPLYRGVVIRWNRWSDIRGGTHNGAAGVRLDDMISGVTVQGNVFERCGAVAFGGVQIHGGKENLIDGNLFIDCHSGVSFNRWGQPRWNEVVQPFLEAAARSPLVERHPEVARLAANADINWVSRNIFANCRSGTFLRHGGVSETAWNFTSPTPLEPELVSDPAAIRAHPRLRAILFDPIPVDDIGPYPHPWRVNGGNAAVRK